MRNAAHSGGVPRRDGTPTAAERKNLERIESNRRYITAGKDLTDVATWSLADVREDFTHDAETLALIDAELARREDS